MATGGEWTGWAIQLESEISIDGKQVNLADFRGHKTIVLFWNPGCGFCQQMLPDLKKWESSPPPDAPKLLVVSTGSPEANREQGIQAPLVLDQSYSVMNSFGANGTPMAVLIDEQGNIASALAVGGPQVLQLAGASQSATA